MGHDILSFLVAELKDFSNHLRFRSHQHSLLVSFIDHGYDFLFRHILRACVRVNSENPQNPFGGNGYQAGYRAEYSGDMIDGIDTGKSPFVGIPGAQLFGNQHPEGKQYVKQHRAGKNHRNNGNCCR